MKDSFGRTITYLRLSVTEACNFRCIYCLPGGPSKISVSPLTASQIEQVIRVAVSLGITNIRLTGGEPLLRRDIVEIVQRIAATDGVTDLALTTNAYLLAELAAPLAKAGLKRVNISLDTLDPQRFAQISGVKAFDRIWRGIDAAEQAGFTPVKLNVVILRGINDDEIESFARLTMQRDWHVRFIELMPVGLEQSARDFYRQHFVPSTEILERLPDLQPLEMLDHTGPARSFRLPGALGIVGVIASASDHFCSACNRIRVTSAGRARSCLFSAQELDLRAAFSQGDEAVRKLLIQTIFAKPEHHPLADGASIEAEGMREIGG